MSVYRKLLFSEEVPLVIRRLYRHLEVDRHDGEQKLYVNMTARAILDAYGETGVSDPVKHNKEVSEARLWFQNGDNLTEMFELCDVDLSVVRPLILKASVDCYMEIPDDKKYPSKR